MPTVITSRIKDPLTNLNAKRFSLRDITKVEKYSLL